MTRHERVTCADMMPGVGSRLLDHVQARSEYLVEMHKHGIDMYHANQLPVTAKATAHYHYNAYRIQDMDDWLRIYISHIPPRGRRVVP